MRYFCDSVKRPYSCGYAAYKPVVCCFHCDKKDHCWQEQINEKSEAKIPCLNTDVTQCDFNF
jgi:hypothetical protein